jgi:hypothetical protein
VSYADNDRNLWPSLTTDGTLAGIDCIAVVLFGGRVELDPLNLAKFLFCEMTRKPGHPAKNRRLGDQDPSGMANKTLT